MKEGPKQSFAEIVDRITEITPATTPAEKRQIRALQLHDNALAGFEGVAAKPIAGWQSKNLGKVIGVPLDMGTHPEKLVDPNHASKGILYALPYTPEDVTGEDMRAVILAPNGEDVDVALVGPLRNSELAAKRFPAIYGPSSEPFVYEGEWNPQKGERPIDTFCKTQGRMSTTVWLVPRDPDKKEELVREALKNAEAIQARRAKEWEAFFDNNQGDQKEAS